MVGSQIGNSTLGHFFGHNLCFKSPNGSCKPISNIYVPKAFQWHKESLNLMSLTRAIALWKFGSPLGLQLPKWELTWECGGSFPHIFLHSWEHEMWLPSSLLARTFANLYLGRKPKARVATISLPLYVLHMTTMTSSWPFTHQNINPYHFILEKINKIKVHFFYN
jgi:hypothetical protein